MFLFPAVLVVVVFVDAVGEVACSCCRACTSDTRDLIMRELETIMMRDGRRETITKTIQGLTYFSYCSAAGLVNAQFDTLPVDAAADTAVFWLDVKAMTRAINVTLGVKVMTSNLDAMRPDVDAMTSVVDVMTLGIEVMTSEVGEVMLSIDIVKFDVDFMTPPVEVMTLDVDVTF